MAVKKICVLGLGQSGVPLSAVFAVKCPEIRVTVVQANPDAVFQWNTGRIPPGVYVPGLDDLIRKCQNKNLFFTTNDKDTIKEADIIFILSESQLKTRGRGAKQVINLSTIEGAAYIIAEHAESDKIVVENSSIPLKTAECVSKVLKYNSKPGIEFQVLSNPEFYEQGNSLQSLLFPDCVLIGSEYTPKGLAAAKLLANIYERWVSPEVIITRKNWSVELSKISTSAMVAQILSSIYAMSAICEEYGGDVSLLVEVLAKDRKFGYGILGPILSVGKFPMVLHNLLYICESNNLLEVADYWRQVLEMFNLHKKRFFKKLIWTLNQTAWSKRIALLGFAYYKDTEVTEGSSAVDLCKLFLEENAKISIYDPRVTKELVIDDVISTGCQIPVETIHKSVSVHDDPYKAADQSQAIVICGVWPELTQLDYSRIFAQMEKPAYVFDGGHILRHSELLDIGFKVYSTGKFIKNYF